MMLEEMMKREVPCCRPSDTLSHVAGVMWDQAVGCVPVVDGEGRPIAMLTDRDICMASYLSGHALWELSVESSMSKRILVARQNQSIDDAAKVMRENRIRRLPIVDAKGKLVGLVSLSDFAMSAAKRKGRAEESEVVAQTLGAISASAIGRVASA